MANVLANIFGKSPVIPLEKHVNISYRCTRELNPFFAAVVKEDWDKASKSRDKIVQLEHEADDLKKKIRLHLPKSLFMPVPRQDLLELLLVQDKMANRTVADLHVVANHIARLVIPDTVPWLHLVPFEIIDAVRIGFRLH